MADRCAGAVPTGPFDVAKHLERDHDLDYDAAIELDSDTLRKVHRDLHSHRAVLAPSHHHHQPVST